MITKKPSSMITKKPILKLIYLALTILLVLSFDAAVKASGIVPDAEDTEDLVGIEELLAVDDEVEKEAEGGSGVKSSEADVLTKAQRIVIELNNDNTKRVIDGFEFVLVLGYAPWCPRSAELMPQFAEAATSLKELGSPLQMAKLDADRYPKPASLLGIKGFPTMLLFVNGSSQLYTGGFTADDIVVWTRKKTGTPVIRISSVAEAEEFLKKHHTFVIGLFDKFEGPDYEEFVKAAMSDNETQFVEVNKAEIAKVLFPDLKHSDLFLGIVKSEPERYSAYDGTFSKDKILEFLDYNKFPLVTKLTEINSMRVYSSPVKLQVYVFSDADELKNLLEPLEDVARTFKSKVMFIHVNINDENLAKPFLTLLGLEESKHTVVAAFENGGSSKFLLESKPTRSNIEEFCNKLVDGSLPPYYKSQPIPDNTNASVHAVVGKNFDDIVLSSEKNVLLESFKVQNLYVGEGTDFSGVPTKFMTVNGSLRMNIYNPSTFFGIHVHSKPINLVFSDIIVASGQLKKHYQPRKSHRVVSVNLEGNMVPLYRAGSTIKQSQTCFEVSLTLKFEILSVGNVVGKLVRAKNHGQITCPLIIDYSKSKPIKFNKTSCSYT